jgi:hypothetical protein
MDAQDPTPPLEDFPQVPDHLRDALALAAREEMEFASDGLWPDDEDEYVERLARLTQATRVIEHYAAGVCVHAEIGKLANIAVGMNEPGRWPRTIEEADDVLSAAVLTRDLILLRDSMGGKPPQEELDEPM